MMDFEFISNSAEETIEFGSKLGLELRGGEVIAVCGTLGSGKTHFIKGVAAGAGAIDSKQVNSPTFVIVNEYKGRLDIYHIDAYRLDSVAEFEMLGFDDFCYQGSVVVIEWADKVASALEGINYIRAELIHEGQKQRSIHVRNMPEYITL